ncbi:serine--tRNA ligase [Candidatus Peribacteria bacterium]|nr:serine--tRNA ligase [Candidatus Peribacteria bacterium]
MVDLDLVRSSPELFQAACKEKNIKLDVSAFLVVDEKRRTAMAETQKMQAERNAVSKKMPTLKDKAEKEKIVKEMKALGEKLKEHEAALTALDAEWLAMQLRLPGIPLANVPKGKDDSENVEIRKWAPHQSPDGSGSGQGTIPTFDFELKDHVALGESLDIIDIPRGVKIAGARSYFLKGDGARLEFALLMFTLDHLKRKGFTAFIPPLLVNYDAMVGTSYFPGGEEMAYAVGVRKSQSQPIESDDVYLIGTSEVSVTSYHGGETLALADLPKRYCGISNCFRREAGTYGKDTHGLYRIHQFQKVEQVILCENDPEVSAKMHKEILQNAEEVLQALKLPYRVVDVCTGDMGQGQMYKNDIETWMPSRKRYGETHSCSTFHDFQSRRLNIKYTAKDGTKKFVHTLNNTCIASPRILIPVLEMYQNADGTVTIPEVLRPYMGGQEKISKPS